MQNERELPKAQWQSAPVVSTTFEQRLQQMVDERASWQDSFESLGLHDIAKVQITLRGLKSVATGNEMQSLEEMFRHCQCCIENGWQWWPAAEAVKSDPVESVVKPGSAEKLATIKAREQKRAEKVANKKQIEAVGLAWREAVAKRREAMAQWDQYVADLHTAYIKAKTELL
jgi:hypothetical protein